MEPLFGVMLILVGLAGTGVVLNREPLHQSIALSFYGLLLTLLFLVLQAPDVALSQLVVGTVIPLVILLALAKTRGKKS